MGGHLFVMRGDLAKLACDDWLLPCAGSLHVSRGFWRAVGDDDALRAAGAWSDGRSPRQDARMAGRAAVPVALPHGSPRPWLVDTTGRDPEGVTSRAVAFVAHVARQPQITRRARRLIALPVVGTGAGGNYQTAGAVLAQLMPALRAAATAHGVDIALVTREAAHYAAAQSLRTAADFTALPAALRQAVTRLARKAQQGQLVLFLGAGVSIGAGLPDWDTLLTRLGAYAGLDAEELGLYEAQHALDRAEYVALKLAAQQRNVGQAVVEVLGTPPCYGLAHGLLAGLPVSESVTTNYDQLFEQASAAAGRPLAVLPREPTRRAGPWLLKMHGCLAHPEDIILTRQNYLRYAVRNAALAGIVQAMLITKHMVFIGFSMRDDNFLRIVDEVRRAVHPDGPADAARAHELGTALMLTRDRLVKSLWTHDLHWEDGFDQGDGVAEAARRLEIFLDDVGYQATAQAHLLDPRFIDALDESDLALRDLLLPLTHASEAAQASPAFAHVRRLLAALGGRGPGKAGDGQGP